MIQRRSGPAFSTHLRVQPLRADPTDAGALSRSVRAAPSSTSGSLRVQAAVARCPRPGRHLSRYQRALIRCGSGGTSGWHLGVTGGELCPPPVSSGHSLGAPVVGRLIRRLERHALSGGLRLHGARGATELEPDHACRRVLPSEPAQGSAVGSRPGAARVASGFAHVSNLRAGSDGTPVRGTECTWGHLWTRENTCVSM